MSLAEIMFPLLFRQSISRLKLGVDMHLPFVKVPIPSQCTLRLEAISDTKLPTPGMTISAGERIGFLGETPVCAPFAGKVTKIFPIPYLPGGRPGFSITFDQNPKAPKTKALEPLDSQATREELICRLDELSVVQPGQGGFLLSSLFGGHQEEPQYRTVLIIAADDEPRQASQAQLLIDNTAKLSEVISSIRRVAGVDDIRIALLLQHASIARSSGIEPVILDDEYPHALRELAARRARDEGASCPIATITLEAALAAHRAITKGEPTFERYLTVIGADETSTNVVVTLGTPISTILDHLGVSVEPLDRLLSGGPMRGSSEYLLSIGLDVRTAGLTVIAQSSNSIPANDPCISCGNCVDICPMQLQPHLLGRNSEFGLFDRNRILDVDLCLLCGLCSYVCPSGRSIAQWIELARSELARQSIGRGDDLDQTEHEATKHEEDKVLTEEDIGDSAEIKEGVV